MSDSSVIRQDGACLIRVDRGDGLCRFVFGHCLLSGAGRRLLFGEKKAGAGGREQRTSGAASRPRATPRDGVDGMPGLWRGEGRQFGVISARESPRGRPLVSFPSDRPTCEFSAQKAAVPLARMALFSAGCGCVAACLPLMVSSRCRMLRTELACRRPPRGVRTWLRLPSSAMPAQARDADMTDIFDYGCPLFRPPVRRRPDGPAGVHLCLAGTAKCCRSVRVLQLDAARLRRRRCRCQRLFALDARRPTPFRSRARGSARRRVFHSPASFDVMNRTTSLSGVFGNRTIFSPLPKPGRKGFRTAITACHVSHRRRRRRDIANRFLQPEPGQERHRSLSPLRDTRRPENRIKFAASRIRKAPPENRLARASPPHSPRAATKTIETSHRHLGISPSRKVKPTMVVHPSHRKMIYGMSDGRTRRKETSRFNPTEIRHSTDLP